MGITTALVWLLIVSNTGSDSGASQLGPFADQASCEKAKEALKSTSGYRFNIANCVQVNMVLR